MFVVVGILIDCSLSANCGLSLLDFCVRETWLRVSPRPSPSRFPPVDPPALLQSLPPLLLVVAAVADLPYPSVLLPPRCVSPEFPPSPGCRAKRYFPERLLPISPLGHPIHPLPSPRTTAKHIACLPIFLLPNPLSPFAQNITRISPLIFNFNGDGTSTRRSFPRRGR